MLPVWALVMLGVYVLVCLVAVVVLGFWFRPRP
jgi:hypothetical protein